MKEHPILFNGEMVRAILDGRKTQTRRVIKPQPAWIEQVGDGEVILYKRRVDESELNEKDEIFCPYGQPGNHLWVRETWAKNIAGCPDGISYRADHIDPHGDGPANPMKWTPSIHMPRWASRITLEVVSVRVELVNEISEEDAEAEGIEWQANEYGVYQWKIPGDKDGWFDYVEDAFSWIWDSINAKRGYGWDANPFVWVISFKKVEV